MISNRRLKAFTLMEISMVILVIALLVAGIMKANILYDKHLLSNARILTNSSPVNVVGGLTLWLETTSTKSFDHENPEDGDAIENWHDINSQLTDKLTFTQGTSSARPTYTKNSINRLPSLLFFDDDSEFMASEDNVLGSRIIASDEVTIFLVQNHLSGHTTSFSWAPGIGSGGKRLNIHATHSSGLYFDYGTCCGSNDRVSQAVSNFSNKNKVISFRKEFNGTFEGRVNGSLTVSSSSFTGTLDLTDESKIYVGALGYSNESTNSFFDGYIGEIIVFNRAITDSQRLEIEEYLAKKWRINF